jgi:hypothetical protein
MGNASIVPKETRLLSFEDDGWFTGKMPGSGSAIKHFQMVPSGDRRLIIVQVEDAGCFVYSQDPSVVTVDGFGIVDPATVPNRVHLAPLGVTTRYLVQLTGQRSGRTFVILCDNAGKTIDSVDVGVKRERKLTYRLWALMDVARRTRRTNDQMIRYMNNTARLYKAQANVTLTQIGVVENLLINDDLGDPISSPNLLLLRCAAFIQFVSTESTADFDMVSTWDIPDAVGLTAPGINVCMVEDYKLGDEMRETSTYAHELCHAFGVLGHDSLTNMLMSGDGTDSVRMNVTDIDTINSTDVPGPPPTPPT